MKSSIRKEGVAMEYFSIHQYKLIIFAICSIVSLSFGSTNVNALSFTSDDMEHSEQTLISQEKFSLFVGVDIQLSASQLRDAFEDLEKFTRKLAQRQHKYHDESQFVRYAFYKIHNRYLKHYSEHATLSELLDKGTYDCITGTAFYALIFDALGIDYVIKELPFHVYLMVQTGESKNSILLESTDPRNGFINDPESVQEMIQQYAKDGQTKKEDRYQYDFVIDGEIELKQLAALNYYNEAVNFYNQQNLIQATYYLDYANHLYPAKRMEALRLLISQVANNQTLKSGR